MTSPPRRSRRRRWSLLSVGLLSLAGMTRWSQLTDRAFFFPTRDAFVTPRGVEDVSFTTADGLTLHGWFLPADGASPQSPGPAILHVHGNAGNVSCHTQLNYLASRGISVLVFDYRGYGRSAPARATRAGAMIDTRAAWDYLLSRSDVDKARAGIVGVSIGCTFASELAATARGARCLALVSPFASWTSIAHEHAPVLGAILIRGGPDPVTNVSRLRGPLLVMHGEEDAIIPAAQGKRVADAASAAKVPTQFILVPQAGHNDVMDTEESRQKLLDFLAAALAPTLR